jgi:hypothetical protein
MTGRIDLVHPTTSLAPDGVRLTHRLAVPFRVQQVQEDRCWGGLLNDRVQKVLVDPIVHENFPYAYQ